MKPRARIGTLIAAILLASFGGESFARNHPRTFYAAYFTGNVPYTRDIDAVVNSAYIDVVYTVRDHHSEFYNVTNNERLTVGQPQNYKHTIWIFGASSVFGEFLPDNETIASYLQAKVSPSYRVVNLARIGLGYSENLYLLKKTPIRPGDLVLWLDGWDAYRSLYDYLNKPLYCGSELLNRTFLCVVYPHPSTGELKAAAKLWSDAGIEASKFVQQQGGAYQRFIIPTLSALQPDNYSGLDLLISECYPFVRTSPGAIDLSPIVNYDLVSMFSDNIHTTALANLILAEAIFNQLSLEF